MAIYKNKPTLNGEGGTTVVANPTLEGTEPDLTGLEVSGTKFKVPQGGGEQVQSDWKQSDPEAKDFIKNKPEIPIVNNSTITFTQGGTTKGSFNLNQSDPATIALDAGGDSDNSEKIYTTKTAVNVKIWMALPEGPEGGASTEQGVWTDGENIYTGSNYGRTAIFNKESGYFVYIDWADSPTRPSCVWTDGDNIYYSDGPKQRVLSIGEYSAKEWYIKTWNGMLSFNGNRIWTDGENIYYSQGSTQKVLNKSTSTWSDKTWTGLTDFNGNRIWTDGENIYYSDGQSQYVLNKSTSTWSTKSWNGMTSFYGNNIWTDGENIYFSDLSSQKVLNKSTSTWSNKTWRGLSNFYGEYIWTDGENIYCSSEGTLYILINSPDINMSPTIKNSVPSRQFSHIEPLIFSSFEFSAEKFGSQENYTIDIGTLSQLFPMNYSYNNYINTPIGDDPIINLEVPGDACICIFPKVNQDDNNFIHGMFSIVIEHMNDNIFKTSLYYWKMSDPSNPLWSDGGIEYSSSKSLYSIIIYVTSCLMDLEQEPVFQLPTSFMSAGASQELFMNSIVVYREAINDYDIVRVNKIDEIISKLFIEPSESSS